MISKKIEQRRIELAELAGKRRRFKTREAELEQALDELKQTKS